MKILAICGSPRKGNTYSVLKSIQENFPDIDFRLLKLSEMNFKSCKGCYACVKKGEENCPVKDDRDLIAKDMMEDDGIIMGSPVYSHMVSVFGFNIVPSLELQFRPGKMPEKNKEQNNVKTLKAVNTLIERIEIGEKDKTKLGMMIPFHIFKYLSTVDKDVMSADYEYYKDKEEYYYEASIPFIKKFLAKRVANKIIAGFD